MAVTHSRVYIFGDQTYDICDLIVLLSSDRGNSLLAAFLENCALTIKEEVRKLSSRQQRQCPRFSKLVDLVPSWRSSTLNPALSQALTTAVQLGAIIQ